MNEKQAIAAIREVVHECRDDHGELKRVMIDRIDLGAMVSAIETPGVVWIPALDQLQASINALIRAADLSVPKGVQQ
jgi:hypothetical protein